MMHGQTQIKYAVHSFPSNSCIVTQLPFGCTFGTIIRRSNTNY